MHDEPTLEGAETPVAVVDLDRARANARRVGAYCREHGLEWRPHVKTHKSRAFARIELEAGARGLTVATPPGGGGHGVTIALRPVLRSPVAPAAARL